MWKTKRQLKAERDEAWRVSDILRDENHEMWEQLRSAHELAKAQLRSGGHGTKCPCRLCRAARIVLNISTAVQPKLRGVG